MSKVAPRQCQDRITKAAAKVFLRQKRNFQPSASRWINSSSTTKISTVPISRPLGQVETTGRLASSRPTSKEVKQAAK